MADLAHAEHPNEHITSVETYLKVFGALMILTVLTVVASYIPFGEPLHTIIALAIAVIKATLVILFFMHVYYNDALTKLAIVTSFLFFFIMILLSMQDYLSRGAMGTLGK